MNTAISVSSSKVTREDCGSKAHSLSRLSKIDDINIPDGFVITSDCYFKHIESLFSKDLDELFETGDLDELSSDIRDKIVEEDVSDEIRNTIIQEYDDAFSDNTRVAVRSSASSEDLEETSSAGQQDTYLNVERQDLVDKVKECWSSIFSKRACVYRETKGISHEDSHMSVVIQKMVDSDVSGVMFTEHPVTGDENIVIESCWGLGEGVVSGQVNPDKFILDRETGELLDCEVKDKKKIFEWDGNETNIRKLPSEKRRNRTLNDKDLSSLYEIAEKITDVYDEPQDIEWCISGSGIYVVQSRPVTVSGATSGNDSREDEVDLEGTGASPGKASGEVFIQGQDKTISEGEILVAECTTPDMVVDMKKASAVVTDTGGVTSHAAIVSRELGTPAVIGTENATSVLQDNQLVTVDGNKGNIKYGDRLDRVPESKSQERNNSDNLITATDVKVNVSLPDMASRASETNADGVGLLRMEHLVLSTGFTPNEYIERNGRDSFVDEITENIRKVAKEFYPNPVRVRTLDAPTDEFTNLKGGKKEPSESNPMLGYRGIRRSLDSDECFECQLMAYNQLFDMGYDNIEILFPLVGDESDVYNIMQKMNSVGLDTEQTDWGVMIETPSSAITIESIIDNPLDFISFGTNDLTQYTLAVDRNNQKVSNRFNSTHKSVIKLMKNVVNTCKKNDIKTSICGEAASQDKMIEELVESGIDSLSVNIDEVSRTRQKVRKKEQEIILDDSR